VFDGGADLIVDAAVRFARVAALGERQGVDRLDVLRELLDHVVVDRRQRRADACLEVHRASQQPSVRLR
jgi:hypothetical protein